MVEQQRLKRLQQLIRERRPRFVLCYGRGNRAAQWSLYESLFEGQGWCSLADGRVRRLQSGDTRAYLMPFFGNGQVSHAELQAVIDDARSGSR